MTILGFTVWEVLGVLSIMCMIAVLIVIFTWLLKYRRICNTIIKELKKPKITKADGGVYEVNQKAVLHNNSKEVRHDKNRGTRTEN